MAVIRDRIDHEVFAADPPFAAGLPEYEVKRGTTRTQWRHLDSRLVYDLCAHPAVVGRLASLYGPDLALWRSLFFVKNPGGAASSWHQDFKSWSMLDPILTITAWIAITEATLENACLQMIPGSHKAEVPHLPPANPLEPDRSYPDPAYYDPAQAVPIELKPGEFFLLDEKVLHYAAPNQSNKRRIGLAVRVTLPSVKVDHAQCFAGHKVIMMNGVDRFGRNELTSPPTA
jgi:ectoine hydroxylase-related dioxygenase (phytanoyl-CoA dioxygenase family)